MGRKPTRGMAFYKVRLPDGRWTPPLLAPKASDAVYYVKENIVHKMLKKGTYFKPFVSSGLTHLQSIKAKYVGKPTTVEISRWLHGKGLKRTSSGIKWKPTTRLPKKRGKPKNK